MVVVVAIHTQTVSHLYTGEKFFAFVGVKPKFKFKCSLVALFTQLFALNGPLQEEDQNCLWKVYLERYLLTSPIKHEKSF